MSPGSWTVRIEMFGFDSVEAQTNFEAAKSPVNFDLQLKQPAFSRRMQGGGQGQSSPPRGESPGGFGNRVPPGGQRSAASPRGQSLGPQSGEAQLENEISSDSPTGLRAEATTNANSDSFLLSGSLSPGMAAGTQADSGPDMRFVGGGPNGLANSDNPAIPGLGTTENQPGGFGGAPGGPSGPGGFGGRGAAGGFSGGGGRGRGSPGGFGNGNRTRSGGPGAVFGNGRRRNQTIHGQASFSLANSAVNAKPFSINGLDVPQAAYAQSRFSLILGGPLVVPKLINDRKTQFFVSYFGTRARNPQLFTETVPTSAQRNGDFSQSVQSLGTSATSAPVTILNPATNQPFVNNQIPISLLNPIALALLRFYPLPNQAGSANNFQFSTTQVSNTDNAGLRIQRSITAKDRLSLNFQYQRRDGTTAQPFGYADETNGYGLNSQLQWTRNISARSILNTQVRFNRNYSEIVPYFSTIPNISAELGIPGISSNPLDAGPPTLNFTNFSALSDATPTLNRNQSQGINEIYSHVKGTHSLSFGIGFARADQSSRTDPNARGTFNFTGVATSAVSSTGQALSGSGYDLADYLLGLPQSSSIQYSQYSNYFLQNQWTSYAQDEWKVKANLTLILGLRYEFFTPYEEKYGREANLAIGPNYSSVTVVTPGIYPAGLIDPDHNNWAPRLALAWRIPGKRTTLIRAGYGVYYNEQAYGQFTNLLAQQPPFATTNSVNTSAANVLTLNRGFATTTPRDVTNSFAVARNYRTPYAGTWNFSVQRDLPGGFFVELGYLGTKGTRLDVRTLPNQAPPGSAVATGSSTQIANAVGFTFDQSIGNSIFHSGHVRIVRRFNRGLSLNAFYQYAKSIDDSSTFGGSGNTVAQNWEDISAERGLSSFDVRHQFSSDFVWTSPAQAEQRGGKLLKSWQVSGRVTAQTGNPLTARELGNSQQLAQTGGVGRGRAEATGQPLDSASGFFNLNAFSVAPTGNYGNAGRNTIPGPGLFSVNAALARSFDLTERKHLEFRLEANNVFNHVNYTGYNTVVNAISYGLPTAASGMRTLNIVVRYRF